jgi:hypothetical protein
MSHELDELLRASMAADTPEWLDRLVTDRVVTLVGNEPSSSGKTSNGSSRAASIRSSIALLRKSWAPAVLPLSSLLRRTRSLQRWCRTLLSASSRAANAAPTNVGRTGTDVATAVSMAAARPVE